jgi:hypothetical protein
MRKLIPILACIGIATAYVHDSYADDPGSGSAVVAAPATGSATPATVATAGSGAGSAITAPPAAPGSSAPTIADPTKAPAQSLSDALAALKQYGLWWGIMLILFTLGTVFVREAGANHWLSADHALPIAVSSVGVIGSALDAKFGGGSWATVGAALMGAVMLIIQKPKPKQQPNAPPPAPTVASAQSST